jgi:hypothetical protein
MKAAGGDLLDLRKRLGHASITVTADIYPAGLDEVDQLLAERTAALVPRQRTRATTDRTETADEDRTKPNSPGAVPRAVAPTRMTEALPRAHVPAIPPMVFQAPTLPGPRTPVDGSWPPPGRRRDRYPHDQH